MLTTDIEKFLDELYNDEIPVDDITVNKDNFLFSMGYMYQFAIMINKGLAPNNKNAFIHHMNTMEQAINFTFKCYKTVNEHMPVGCKWQQKLVLVISEGSTLYKEEKITEEDQIVIIQGIDYPLRKSNK